jgi:hypothetical protein
MGRNRVWIEMESDGEKQGCRNDIEGQNDGCKVNRVYGKVIERWERG